MPNTELVALPQGYTERQFLDIVNAATAAVNSLGRIPKVEEIGRYSSVTNKVIAKCIQTKEFKDLMRKRGYDFSDRAHLTSEQVWCVSIITDPTNRKPLREKLAQAGIEYRTYRAWLNQPLFARYIKEIGEKLLVDHIQDVHTRVVERASNGDIQAMRLYYDLIGRTDSNTNKAVADLNATVRLLLEVLMRNISDVETLSRITKEIEQITSGSGSNNQISQFSFDIVKGDTIA